MNPVKELLVCLKPRIVSQLSAIIGAERVSVKVFLKRKLLLKSFMNILSPADQSLLVCGAFRRFVGSLLQCLINLSINAEMHFPLTK
jgi:hypothetical protein